MFRLLYRCGCDCDCVVDQALDRVEPEKIDAMYFNRSIRAKCVDVYDGDTFTVLHMMGSEPVKAKVRIFGIDAPEMKQPKNLDEDSRRENKKKAEASKARLQELILNKPVNLVTRQSGSDKYGRILCDITVSNGFACFAQVVDIRKTLLDERYAHVYDGGNKKKAQEDAELLETESPASDKNLTRQKRR